MELTLYQIDAFTDTVFKGNPAAVCPLTEWLPAELMQQIAAENNLAETAFFVKKDHNYELRWFTPTTEVDLCGHATLSAAFVLFHHEGHSGNIIEFHSPRSGRLTVQQHPDGFLALNFPADTLSPLSLTEILAKCVGTMPAEAYQGAADYLLVYDNEEKVGNFTPDIAHISKIPARGIICTAPGNEVDFVSRFFGPRVGVDEDPVTGSAHTTLIPYWSERLQKDELTAKQVSRRGGFLKCKNLGDRVEISGKAVLYLKGSITVSG